jgi:hypothetical protein
MPATSYVRSDSTTLEAAGTVDATDACRAHITCSELAHTNVTSLPGLVPSAVLNVEFLSRGSVTRSSGGATAGSAAGAGYPESWPAWLLRLGLTAIMLPFRLVGAFFGTQQTYEPLPQQSPAAGSGRAPTRGQAPSSVRNARQDKPVEFYNGKLRFLDEDLPFYLLLTLLSGGAETGSGTVVTAPPDDDKAP